MGGQAMDADRISRDNINPTVAKYERMILSFIPHTKVVILGSAGKKESSGDIDLGFETNQTINQVSEILTDLGIRHKVGKGFDQIWTAFPQYDSEGAIDKIVQIDLMFGQADWLQFAYWAPSPEETAYTAHHRSALLAAIIRYAYEKEFEDGVQTYVLNWGSGLWTKKRIEYIGRDGSTKEKQIKSVSPVITTPQGVADFMTENTGVKWTIEDMTQSFEKLWAKTENTFNKDVLVKIAEYTRGAIEHRGPEYKVPEVLL